MGEKKKPPEYLQAAKDILKRKIIINGYSVIVIL
jgi:hypothetical protein